MQSNGENAAAQLPPLRGELRLVKGAPDAHGAPTWIIHDPVRHRHFQIGRDAFDILSHWSRGTAKAVAAAAGAERGSTVDGNDVAEVVRFLQSNRLLVADDSDAQRRLLAQADAGKQSWAAWIIHNYLFMRFPLVRPQAFLRRTLPSVAPLFGTAGLAGCFGVTLLGLYLVSRQWDAFIGTFPHFFSVEGAAIYGVTLVLVKIAHELGHAYMATHYGVRVGTMGVAFMVMMPVLYTDVTEAWQLASRRQRMLINAAGVIVELMIAGVATCLWAFLPDGPLRWAAFVLATTGWLTTLAINLNPFMRFDGYYLLSDGLGLPNLQQRAFAMGRWWLRELLFGLRERPPEEIGAGVRRFMIGYALTTWISRLLLFIGIALVVYQMFFKLLGVVLFAVEIVWFVAKPIWSEAQEWWRRKQEIVRSRRARLTGTALAAAALWTVLPVQATVTVPAVLRAQQEARLFAPRPALVAVIHVREGDVVEAGHALLELTAPDLDLDLALTGQRVTALRSRLDRRTGDTLERAGSLVLEQQLAKEITRQAGLVQERVRLVVRAPFAGIVSDLDPDVHAGRWINQRNQLALVRSRQGAALAGYAAESDVGRLEPGATGTFIPDDPTQPKVAVRLTAIAPTSSEALEIPYLASIHDGAVAVESDSARKLRPRQAHYLITLDTPSAAPAMTLRGAVVIEGRAVSAAGRSLHNILQVLVRETGL